MKTLNIVIPLAGKGSRFEQAGYSFPKPLIDVNGEAMIMRVVENLHPTVEWQDIKFHFIVQKEHMEKYDLMNVLKQAANPYEFTITEISGQTEGAACTVLMASQHFNNDDPLMFANSDQIIDSDAMSLWFGYILGLAERSSDQEQVDGAIMLFEANHPKWSYARTAKSNGELRVFEVAEKKMISNAATTGIYWFKKGKDFVEAASEMIRKDIRTNNEFYVCPVYNELILADKVIAGLEIDPNAMHGIGTPEDLQSYLAYLKTI